MKGKSRMNTDRQSPSGNADWKMEFRAEAGSVQLAYFLQDYSFVKD